MKTSIIGGFSLRHIDDFDHAQLQAMNFAAHFPTAAKPEGIMSLKKISRCLSQALEMAISPKLKLRFVFHGRSPIKRFMETISAAKFGLYIRRRKIPA